MLLANLNDIKKMLEQQREFAYIYMQLSSVKASIEEIEVMLIAQEGILDKRYAALFRIMSRKMEALEELHR